MVELGRMRSGRSRRRARLAIPSVDTGALAPAARRTRIALTVLALVTLAAATALVPAASRSSGFPRRAPGWRRADGRDRVSSSTLGISNMIAKSLLALANDPSQRAGLVLASQSAYVALPPETPGSALRGWQRMIDYIDEQNNKLAVRAKLDRRLCRILPPATTRGSGCSRAGPGSRQAWRAQSRPCGSRASAAGRSSSSATFAMLRMTSHASA